MLHQMTQLIFQISIIILAAKLSGLLFKKIKLPSVTGEILAGIIIGPYLLGSIPFPGFTHGLFPLVSGSAIPVTPELYGFATIASIILLFMAGLETDIDMFLQLSSSGIAVGIGGIIVSFFTGLFIASYMLAIPPAAPEALFLGVICTATSVGISVRILSEKRKMDSPEGTVILGGAIIDDVLGIILLAVVIGMSVIQKHTGAGPRWGKIGFIALKEIGIWLFFMIIGLVLAQRISRVLKYFKNLDVSVIIAFGLALLLAGVFEKAGLAMIIGAYVMGLIFSKTDLRYVIQEKLGTVQGLFIPIFFTVIGMMVNVHEIFTKEVIIFGLVLTTGAVASKVIGCGLPALFLNFNIHGALRIGLGMVPRAEVALIIAGIGLSSGILDQSSFGVVIMMSLITIIISPVLFSRSLSFGGKGVKKDITLTEKISTAFNFPSEELTELLKTRLLQFFTSEEFFIYKTELDYTVYQMRKEDIFITLYWHPASIIFLTSKKDVTYVRTVVYEALLALNETISKLKHITKPPDMRKEISDGGTKDKIMLEKFLDADCIIVGLISEDKEQLIEEMIEVLDRKGKLLDKKEVLEAVMVRERSMSTGMQHGIALPHGKTAAVDKMVMAVGIKKQGIDFQSADGLPSTIFILLLSPVDQSGPHIQLLAKIGSLLNNEKTRERILAADTKDAVYKIFMQKKE
ncbi:cation:proton antiporter [Spirochaetota bacterium]